METVNEYIITYPFPAINMETITKAVNTVYNTNYTLEEIEKILCSYFILNLDETKTDKAITQEIDFYNIVNLNEPCCNSTGECKTCSSKKLCEQIPEE